MEKKKIFATGAVVTGIAVATGAGIFCGMKYAQEVERMKKDLNRELNAKEKVVTGLKYFSIPCSIAAASIIAVVVIYKDDAQTKAALVGSYTILSDRFQAFKAKVENEIGEEKMHQIENEAAVESFKYDGPIPDKDSDEKVYLDEFSNEAFVSTDHKIMEAFYILNAAMSADGFVRYNDLRKLLGLPGNFNKDIAWDSCDMYEEYQTDFIDYAIEPYVIDGVEFGLLRYPEPIIL